MRLFLAVALSLVAGAAMAQQNTKQFPFWPWVKAGSYSPPNAVHMTMWLNMETVRRVDDGVMEGWIKYANDRADESGAMETLVYERLDCHRNWHASISLMKYDRAGKVVFAGKAKPEDMEPIIPNSLLAGMMPFTCAAGGMPQ